MPSSTNLFKRLKIYLFIYSNVFSCHSTQNEEPNYFTIYQPKASGENLKFCYDHKFFAGEKVYDNGKIDKNTPIYALCESIAADLKSQIYIENFVELDDDLLDLINFEKEWLDLEIDWSERKTQVVTRVYEVAEGEREDGPISVDPESDNREEAEPTVFQPPESDIIGASFEERQELIHKISDNFTTTFHKADLDLYPISYVELEQEFGQGENCDAHFLCHRVPEGIDFAEYEGKIRAVTAGTCICSTTEIRWFNSQAEPNLKFVEDIEAASKITKDNLQKYGKIFGPNDPIPDETCPYGYQKFQVDYICTKKQLKKGIFHVSTEFTTKSGKNCLPWRLFKIAENNEDIQNLETCADPGNMYGESWCYVDEMGTREACFESSGERHSVGSNPVAYNPTTAIDYVRKISDKNIWTLADSDQFCRDHSLYLCSLRQLCGPTSKRLDLLPKSFDQVQLFVLNLDLFEHSMLTLDLKGHCVNDRVYQEDVHAMAPVRGNFKTVCCERDFKQKFDTDTTVEIEFQCDENESGICSKNIENSVSIWRFCYFGFCMRFLGFWDVSLFLSFVRLTVT